MNSPHALAVAGGLLLQLLLALDARSAAAKPAPQKYSLAIPVTTRGAPARSIERLVICGGSSSISAVAFSPFSHDGKTLAIGGYQELVTLVRSGT